MEVEMPHRWFEPSSKHEDFASRRTFLSTFASLSFMSNLPASTSTVAESVNPANATRAATTDSDVGSLFPFIQSQATRDFPLSFLHGEHRDLVKWKKKARTQLLDLLHYHPAKVKPMPEVVEKVDQGECIREKVWFNTTPELRVPAYVLIPKNASKPLPGIIALHDHGGFYLWGKEKIVALEWNMQR